MFSRAELEELVTMEVQPAISIYPPTHVAGREGRQDPIRLKNLISAAAERLGASRRLPKINALLSLVSSATPFRSSLPPLPRSNVISAITSATGDRWGKYHNSEFYRAVYKHVFWRLRRTPHPQLHHQRRVRRFPLAFLSRFDDFERNLRLFTIY